MWSGVFAYHSTDDGDGVGQQIPPRDLIHTSQMGESRSPNLAPVRPLAAVRDKENTHLALGRLDGAVSLARWHCVTLAEEQEVVNKGLHVLLHGRAGRGRERA